MQKKNEEKTNTIFIQIAAYRDPQLLPTIKDCLEKAKYPKNLRFGIALQQNEKDEWESIANHKRLSRKSKIP